MPSDDLAVARRAVRPAAVVIEATAARRAGDPDRAIELIDSVLPRLRRWGEEAAFLAVEELAAAWVDRGEPLQASRTLELTRDMKARAAFGARYRPYLWLRAQGDLARLYRAHGQDDRALEVEEAIAALLAAADPRHALRGLVPG